MTAWASQAAGTIVGQAASGTWLHRILAQKRAIQSEFDCHVAEVRYSWKDTKEGGSMSLVIALTGTTGVGKTTVADHLVLNHGFQRLRFSDPLRQMLSGLLVRQGCTPDYVKRCIEGDLKTQPIRELAGRSPRHAMLTLANGWGCRTIHPDLWVTCWRSAVVEALRKGPVVADDCRSGNEYEAVHELDGLVWRIARDVSALQAGASEDGLPGFDCDANLLNNSSVNTLLRRVNQLLRDYRRTKGRQGGSLPVKWQGERARRRLTTGEAGASQQGKNLGHRDHDTGPGNSADAGSGAGELDSEREQVEVPAGWANQGETEGSAVDPGDRQADLRQAT
jgi:hypothetical protein